MRQVNHGFQEVIDSYRGRREENKGVNMGSDGAESSGENSDLANGDANATIYAQAMADLKEALLRNQLTKKVSRINSFIILKF